VSAPDLSSSRQSEGDRGRIGDRVILVGSSPGPVASILAGRSTISTPRPPGDPFFAHPVAAEGAGQGVTPLPLLFPTTRAPQNQNPKKNSDQKTGTPFPNRGPYGENPQKNSEDISPNLFHGAPAHTWPVVLNYGGGDNSRALAIEMVRRGVRPDLIIFSDTGGENPRTYAANLEFDAWLQSKGFPGITVVSDGRRTLEQEVLEANTLPSIVFGFKSCSDKYKIRPINRAIARWHPAVDSWAKRGKVVKLIGYDANEGHRVKDYDDSRYLVRYPLIDWGYSRRDCTEIVRRAGFEPAKSACFFCPSSRKPDVLRLAKESPELFARAVAMERNATAATTVKGLGRHWSWEQLAAADAEQLKMFEELPDEVPCGCIT
jgi:hypothetical protein